MVCLFTPQLSLVLINQPRRDGTLSWRWYTAAIGGIRTSDLAVASPAPYHSATVYLTPSLAVHNFLKRHYAHVFALILCRATSFVRYDSVNVSQRETVRLVTRLVVVVGDIHYSV